MLQSLREIQEYRIQAQDGEFGKIHSFLVDDFEWILRYLVVEVGSRTVLLSVRALGMPDRDGQVFPVNVSTEFMMNSPVINLDRPLSREIERQLSDYFEWPYYWDPTDVPNTAPGDLTSIPLIDMELEREQNEEELIPQTGGTGGVNSQDYHLRSSKTLFGDAIHATNDDQGAGRLYDIITQDEDWNVLYLVVDTGGLLSGKKVLVSPNWVEQIDEMDSRIDVNLSSETVKDSPEFRDIEDLTDDYQNTLHDYYGE